LHRKQTLYDGEGEACLAEFAWRWKRGKIKIAANLLSRAQFLLRRLFAAGRSSQFSRVLSRAFACWIDSDRASEFWRQSFGA